MTEATSAGGHRFGPDGHPEVGPSFEIAPGQSRSLELRACWPRVCKIGVSACRPKDRSPCGRSSARGSAEQTVPCSDSLDDITECLARFEEGYLLLWHFDSRSSFWIPSDA